MAKPANEFYDLEKLADWTVRLLYIGLALLVVGCVSTWFELQLLQAMRDGYFESEEAMLEAAESSDQRQLVMAMVVISGAIVTAVFSLVWIYRSAHNARVHAASVEYTPGACVWWFFIPIAWLWKPYSAMSETFSQSLRQAGHSGDSANALLGWWWACWIISGIVSYAILKMSWNAEGLNTLINSDKLSLFASVIDFAATLLFIAVVRKLTRLLAHVRAHPPQPAIGMPGANW